MRAYRDEDDYWHIREFLRQVLLLEGHWQRSWHVARLDYWRWHGIENCKGCRPIEAVTWLWEADGQIVATLNPEGSGEAFLQVHPAWRSTQLEEEMLAVAEERLAAPNAEGKRLYVWANARDNVRRDVLTRRGYVQKGKAEYQRRCWMSAPLPDVPVAGGYTVRALGDVEELPARSWASWRAFHPDEPDERYQGWEWYHNIQRQPLYRRDLDMVAVAPSGEVASFCTIWYDDVTRSGYVEPVGTAPEHQRHGLGKAVMSEGLRRLARLGALVAFVGSYSATAHALYNSVGFTEYELCEPWVKELL